MNQRESRLRLLPPIRRARLWRLYAEDGRRFLDLWQDGGRSILGAKASGLGSALKAAVDMGLDRPLPSIAEKRLEKELLRRYPGHRAVRLYRSESSALGALARAVEADSSQAGSDLLDSPLVLDPARQTPGAATSAPGILLRPFASFLPPGPPALCSIPLLPCPRAFAPAAVLFTDAAAAERAGPSELIPPLMLRAAFQALLQLGRYEEEVGETQWGRADRRLGGFFERRGPYLYPLETVGDYERFFRKALGQGILIAPDPGLPSILPGDFDDGELARLAKD